jgi:hypothetical protein
MDMPQRRERRIQNMSAEQAHAIQRERSAARLSKTEEPASNIVYGIDFNKGRA